MSQFFDAIKKLNDAKEKNASQAEIARLQQTVDDMRTGFKELSAAEVQEYVTELGQALHNIDPEAFQYMSDRFNNRRLGIDEPPESQELELRFSEAWQVYGSEQDGLARLRDEKKVAEAAEAAKTVNDLPQWLECTSLENLATQLRQLAGAVKPNVDNTVQSWSIHFHGVKISATLVPTNPSSDGAWELACKISERLGAGEKDFAREATIDKRDLKFLIKVVGSIPKIPVKKSGYWRLGTWYQYN